VRGGRAAAEIARRHRPSFVVISFS